MKKGIKVLCGLFGVGIPVCSALICQQKCIDCWKEESEKQRAMFLLMNQWTRIKQEGENLEKFFLENDYKKIAVYGMGAIGQRLVKELKDSKIEVVYGIDRDKSMMSTNITVKTMDEKLGKVDVVVVTVLKEFDVICKAILQKLNCEVLPIEDIINQF